VPLYFLPSGIRIFTDNSIILILPPPPLLTAHSNSF
jgi:hypothetical protein